MRGGLDAVARPSGGLVARAPRAGSGTASRRWSWAARSCGWSSARSFMIALSLPYWFQAHPDGEGRGIKTGLAGISTLARRHPDQGSLRPAAWRSSRRQGCEASADIVIEADGVGTPARQPGAPGELAPEYADRGGHARGLDRRRSQPGNAGAAAGERRRLGRAGPIPLAGAATDSQGEAAVAAIASLRDTYVPEAFDGTSAHRPGRRRHGVREGLLRHLRPVHAADHPGGAGVVVHPAHVVFRSIVVPVKAIIMNLLSVGAAYGLIVLVFQKGGPAIGEIDREPARASSRSMRSRRGCRCSCSRSCSGSRWTTTCSC